MRSRQRNSVSQDTSPDCHAPPCMVEDTTGQDPLESWPETTRKSLQRLTPLGRTFGSSRRTCHRSLDRYLGGLDEDSARQNKMESRGKKVSDRVTHRAPGSFASHLRELWYSTCPLMLWEVFRSVLWYLHQLLPLFQSTRLWSLLDYLCDKSVLQILTASCAPSRRP